MVLETMVQLETMVHHAVQDCCGLQKLLKKMLNLPQEKLGLRYCHCQHRILPLHKGKGNEQKLWG